MWVVVTKYADEGTNSPWVTYCMLQIMSIRQQVFYDDKKKLDRFDKLHLHICDKLNLASKAMMRFKEIFDSHITKFYDWSAYTQQGENYIINEAIDAELASAFNEFIINLDIAVTDVGKKLWGEFWLKCWWLYWKSDWFLKWIESLNNWTVDDKALAEMFSTDRSWIEKIGTIRDNIIHHEWKLGELKYNFSWDKTILYPEEISFIDWLWNNSWHFIEDMLIIILQRNIQDPLCIYRIPDEEITPERPQRYQIGLKESINLFSK